MFWTAPEHRRVVLLIGGAGVLAAAAALWLFQPQKLVLDDEVREPPPSLEGSGGTGRSSGSAPVVVSRGVFRGLAHQGTGKALVVNLEDGRHVLRLEDLKVENGPDLRVYLSTAQATAPEATFDDEFIDVGALKGNIGDQNYEIPQSENPARYRSAVIWCRRFSVGFAVASLEPAP